MNWFLVICGQSGTRAGACRVTGTQDDEDGWTITSLMSVGFTRLTVTRKDGLIVRKCEQTE